MGRSLQLCSHRQLSCVLRASGHSWRAFRKRQAASSEINGEKGPCLGDGVLDQDAYGRGEEKGRGPRHIL